MTFFFLNRRFLLFHNTTLITFDDNIHFNESRENESTNSTTCEWCITTDNKAIIRIIQLPTYSRGIRVNERGALIFKIVNRLSILDSDT